MCVFVTGVEDLKGGGGGLREGRHKIVVTRKWGHTEQREEDG